MQRGRESLTLEAQLSQLLTDEDIALDQVNGQIVEKTAELAQLTAQGKGTIKKAERLKVELQVLDNIAKLRDEIKLKKSETSELGALQQELAEQLADEDIADIPTLLKQIAAQEAALA